MKNILISSKDDYALHLNIYECEQPKAVIQIIHGMQEHQDRYFEFATFFQSRGYIVVTSNLRGHGEDCKDLGFFKDKDGEKFLIYDQIEIRDWISKNYSNLPVYLVAHSMGTIISRVLLKKSSKFYDKIVLIGYPPYQKNAYLGVFLAFIIRLFCGKKHKSKLLHNLTLGRFNKKIKNSKTNCDWVCSNENIIKKYKEDKFCGFYFTTSAFIDLFKLLIEMGKFKNCVNVKKELPILLLSGDDDACTLGESGRKKSINLLNKYGFTNINEFHYKKMRHEILNEINNKKVYYDILKFLF